MESQMAHSRGHGHDHDYANKASEPHLVGEGEDEHHHQKKSVLKKVKAKARKIKDTIKKHVQDHDHEHDHDYRHDGDRVPDDHDLDEEDDEDEEIVEDPEIHGASVFESAAMRTGVSTPVNTPLSSFSDHGVSETKEAFVPGTESRVNMERVPPVSTPQPSFFDIPSKTSVPGNASVEGPYTKTHLSSFPDHGVSSIKEYDPSKTFVLETESYVTLDKPAVNTQVSSFSPGISDRISDIKESDPSKTFVPGTESRVNLDRPKGLEEDPHAPKDFPHEYTPSNYQTKVTDPTGAGAKEVGITPILRSFDKMNIRNGSEPKPSQNPTNIGTSTGSHDQFSPEPFAQNPINTPQNPETDQELLDTVRHETHSHDNTTQKSSIPTSYTQKISSATSVIADKAISAKNAVASKLGYGEKNDTGEHGTTGGHGSAGTNNTSASAAEYGKKIAATVTGKLTPVYEKVAGAGSAVVSKMHGPASPASETESTTSGTRGQDKGVSVKDYLAEKLRPGDEDKALSEVISDALHLRKHEPEKESEPGPVGKVTVSEGVEKRLGGADESNEEKEDQSSYVNKLRGTVGSWFGLSGDQSRASRDSPGHSQAETGEKIQGEEERRLQESGN